MEEYLQFIGIENSCQISLLRLSYKQICYRIEVIVYLIVDLSLILENHPKYFTFILNGMINQPNEIFLLCG